jgi:inner membrane protein
MEWFSAIHFWHWLIIAVILICLEMLITGTYYFIWMGVSAAIVGCIMFFVPTLTWLSQVIIFTLLSVLTIIIFRIYQKQNPVVRDQPALNRRGEQYIGRVFTLEEPIVNGVGKVKVDDSTWKVSGEELSAGTRVKVIAVDNTVLRVIAI